MDQLSDYDFDLPEGAIAQVPLEDRAAAKMLWLHKSGRDVEDRTFRDLARILRSGDLLVMNNTRVTALRLFGKKDSGGAVELLLIKQVAEGRFEALAKPGKRLKPGAQVSFEGGLRAMITADLDAGRKEVQFELAEGWRARLEASGSVPLPPYIHHQLENPERYQTVYSSNGGSAAAPTAGLHFTPELLEQLRHHGVGIAYVTLDVSIDTFKPVQTESLDDHVMHGETCSVPHSTVEAVQRCSGRIVAVGTTTVRTLETFATGPRQLRAGTEASKLFIRPGFRFQIIDGMLTNFHMPRTTMLVMLAALVGREPLLRAYHHALAEKYRFLSFGDSMLIL